MIRSRRPLSSTGQTKHRLTRTATRTADESRRRRFATRGIEDEDECRAGTGPARRERQGRKMKAKDEGQMLRISPPNGHGRTVQPGRRGSPTCAPACAPACAGGAARRAAPTRLSRRRGWRRTGWQPCRASRRKSRSTRTADEYATARFPPLPPPYSYTCSYTRLLRSRSLRRPFRTHANAVGAQSPA